MNRQGRLVNSENLTPSERAYYRDTWGFDPLDDRKKAPPLSRAMPAEDSTLWGDPLPEGVESQAVWREWVYNSSTDYYYDTDIPLENDSELQAAGVTVHARVNVDIKGRSHNRIIFARAGESSEVECVHTAVYDGPSQEVLELSEVKLKQLVRSTESRPAILPPWEHFAAMKSYVAGIASVGFLDSINFVLHDEEKSSKSDLLGINTEMVTQLRKALFKVAPQAMIASYMRVLGDLFERKTARWLANEWATLVHDFAAYKVLAHTAFWDALPPLVQEKVREATRIENEPVRKQHPELFDARIDLLALPDADLSRVSNIDPFDHASQVDIYHGRKFFGYVTYEKFYDIQNRAADPFINAQVLVLAIFNEKSRDEEVIYYREGLGEKQPNPNTLKRFQNEGKYSIPIIAGSCLCPRHATRSQIFGQMCVLADKIALMNGETLHLAATLYRSTKSAYFLNCLAEFDNTAARAIVSFIHPATDKHDQIIKSFNFLNGLSQ